MLGKQNQPTPRFGLAPETRRGQDGSYLTEFLLAKGYEVQKLYLGNLEARRDWGYAPDYVRAMWLMLQRETPDDFAIGTGEAHTVREFVDLAFTYAGLDWRDYVEVDARYFRPAEVDYLCADASKARGTLRWEPTVTFPELVRLMVEADLKHVESRIEGGVESLQHAIAAEGRHS